MVITQPDNQAILKLPASEPPQILYHFATFSPQTQESHYDERKRANKTYTSQVTESHIDSLINTKHKRMKKMQWTREGAHHVLLQIRAMMASDDWKRNCQATVFSALGAVA